MAKCVNLSIDLIDRGLRPASMQQFIDRLMLAFDPFDNEPKAMDGFCPFWARVSQSGAQKD
jgi:hypothetical protein